MYTLKPLDRFYFLTKAHYKSNAIVLTEAAKPFTLQTQKNNACYSFFPPFNFPPLIKSCWTLRLKSRVTN